MNEQTKKKIVYAMSIADGALQLSGYGVESCARVLLREALAAAEPKPHVFTGKTEDPGSANCGLCWMHMSHEIHLKPKAETLRCCENGYFGQKHECMKQPADQPTREELIDALRRAEQLLSRPSRPHVEEMRDRVIFNGILAKCDPKPEPKSRRWVVEFVHEDKEFYPTAGHHCYVSAVIREAKPVTRQSVWDSANKIGANLNTEMASHWREVSMRYHWDFLRELGIQVED